MYIRNMLMMLVISSQLCASEGVLVLRSPERVIRSSDSLPGNAPSGIHEDEMQFSSQKADIRVTLNDIDCWKNKVLPKLLSIKENDAFDDYVRQLREKLSYGVVNEGVPYCFVRDETLEAIKEIFDGAEAELTKALEVWTSIKQVKWSCQTTFQAFMGHLFFPAQYDIGLETSLLLGGRSLLQSLLAISASYKNLLACHHVGDLLKTYREMADEQAAKAPRMKSCLDVSEETREVLASVDLDDFIKKLMKEAAESNPEEEKEPHFYCGKLCIFYHKRDNVDLRYQLGCKMGSIPCTFKYARRLSLRSKEQKDELRRVIAVLKDKFPGMATFLSARLASNPLEKLALCKKAGDLGFTMGYTSAGNISHLLKRNADETLGFYLKATESKRVLAAFRNVADLALEKDNLELAKKVYKEMGDLGDKYGYAKLGNIFCDDESDEKGGEQMEKYYLKAGEGGYHQLLLSVSRTKKPTLKRAREELMLQNVRKLKRIAPDEKL